MNERRTLGGLGTLVIALVVLIAVVGFVGTTLADPSGAYFAGTLVSLAIAAGLVIVLSVVGARSGRWLEGPYW